MHISSTISLKLSLKSFIFTVTHLHNLHIYTIHTFTQLHIQIKIENHKLRNKQFIIRN